MKTNLEHKDWTQTAVRPELSRPLAIKAPRRRLLTVFDICSRLEAAFKQETIIERIMLGGDGRLDVWYRDQAGTIKSATLLPK